MPIGTIANGESGSSCRTKINASFALLDAETAAGRALATAADAAAQRTALSLTALATTTPGTGVATALAVNVGSAGAFITFNGDAGTPSALVGTNVTGTAAGLTAGVASAVAVGGITGLGTGVATTLATNLSITGGGTIALGGFTATIPATLTVAGLGIANVFTAAQTISVNGAFSAPGFSATGTWITGGTSTTTKPYILIETAGATSSGWSTSGTGIGLNAATGFVGNFLDFKVNGVAYASLTTGALTISGMGIYPLGGADRTGIGTSAATAATTYLYIQSTGVTIRSGALFCWSSSATDPTSVADTLFNRKAAASIGLGTLHATTPTAQTLSAHNVTTGTGASLTLAGGTGSVAGGACHLAASVTTGAPVNRVTADAVGLGFYAVTPIARPTTAYAAATFAANTSLIANDTATWGGYTMGAVVGALRGIGILT